MFNTNVFLLTFINNKSLPIVQVLNGRSFNTGALYSHFGKKCNSINLSQKLYYNVEYRIYSNLQNHCTSLHNRIYYSYYNLQTSDNIVCQNLQ